MTNAAILKLGKACKRENNERSIYDVMMTVKACFCTFLGHCVHKTPWYLVRMAHYETSDPNDKKVREATTTAGFVQESVLCVLKEDE